MLIYFIFILGFIELFIPRIQDVYVSDLFHALITSLGSNYLLFTTPHMYLNIFKYHYHETPILYQQLPYYTMIYSFIDMYYSIQMKSKIMIFHAFVMIITTFLCLYYGYPHYASVGLMLETSSIFLNLKQYKKPFFEICFGLSFIFYRNLLFTYICMNYYIYVYENQYYYDIFHGTFSVLGLLFNGMNFFWGIKIFKNINKKMKYN